MVAFNFPDVHKHFWQHSNLSLTPPPSHQMLKQQTPHILPLCPPRQEVPSTWRAAPSSGTAETSVRSSTGWRVTSSSRIWMRSGFRRLRSSKAFKNHVGGHTPIGQCHICGSRGAERTDEWCEGFNSLLWLIHEVLRKQQWTLRWTTKQPFKSTYHNCGTAE